MTAELADPPAPIAGSSRLLATRLAIGLGQGVAAALLYEARRRQLWPSDAPSLFSALTALVLFLPIVAHGALGRLKPRPMSAWLAIAAIVVAGLALHDMMRRGTLTAPDVTAPTPPMLFVTAIALFVAHALIVAGAEAGRVRAAYPAYFDGAWKQAMQLALAVAFVVALWLVLLLGGLMFKVIGLEFFDTLIRQSWFAAPATAIGFAAAVHLTDANVRLVRAVRTVMLQLLAVLLPVMTLIATGFIVALAFTGLGPLWATKLASPALLGGAASLVVLINATYQDGGDQPGTVLRWASRIACVLLVPLVALAVYGLGLRVAQHGWTDARIAGASVALVLSVYAVWYASAALRRLGPWLAGIELANVAVSWLILAVLLALFTPLADPARLSVVSQVARLERGGVTAEDFDFAYLRDQGERYGEAALRRFSEQAGAAAAVRERAAILLQPKVQPDSQGASATPMAPERFIVHPAGRTLPPSFLTRQWAGPLGPRPNCIWDTGLLCDIVIVELDGAGDEELIVLGRQQRFPPPMPMVLRATATGWEVIGTLPFLQTCPGLRDKLLAGEFSTEARPYADLDIGGIKVPLDTNTLGCPPGIGLID